MDASSSFSVFQDGRRIAAGPVDQVLPVVRAAAPGRPVLVFDDATGAQIDLDVRAGALPVAEQPDASTARPRGRPKLGVVAREVTLLPRHWAWLSSQPGGASVALRRLVEEASRSPAAQARAASEAAYRFLQAIAGDLPGYEEALRALFARDRARFMAQIAPWPSDISAHALRLGFPDR